MNAPDRLRTTMSVVPPDSQQHPAGDAHWRDLIGQIGSDVGQSLSSALERVTVLATTGKIDRAGLRALREEIEQARRAGMIGQQLARFASGRIRQAPEQVPLTQMLRDVLIQRGREAAARDIELRQALRPAEVVADPTLLHALLQALVDWSLEHARGAIQFRVDMRAWPQMARLSCQFSHAECSREPASPSGEPDALPPAPSALDTMSWRLVQQIAWTLGLVIERTDSTAGASLSLDFPNTVHEQIEGVTAVELDPDYGAATNSKPLAGHHVLMLASRRDLRADLREAVRHMGLVVDFVNTVEEAEEFCRDASPHAIVYESTLAGERFERLGQALRSELPGFAMIQIAEEGAVFQLSGEAPGGLAVVGREAVVQSLPSALIFELSKSM
jgi:hypothetical protein